MHLLIYNPVSGKKDLSRVNTLQDIKNKLDNKNIKYDLLLTENDKTIDKYFETNAKAYDCVIVAGGDGTISQAIDAMNKHKINANLLMYPKGTTNEFCSAVGVNKLTLDKYLDDNTEVEDMDIGYFNGENVFVYSMTFGNYTHVTYQTPQWLKNKIGYVAYWFYSVYSLYFLKIRKYNMKVTTADNQYEGSFVFGGVSNSHSLGKVIQLKDVDFSDGLYELFLVRTPKNLKDLRSIIHSLVTNNYDNEMFVQSKGSEFKFESRSSYSWNKDGEFPGKFSEMNIKVSGNQLHIIK